MSCQIDIKVLEQSNSELVTYKYIITVRVLFSWGMLIGSRIYPNSQLLLQTQVFPLEKVSPNTTKSQLNFPHNFLLGMLPNVNIFTQRRMRKVNKCENTIFQSLCLLSEFGLLENSNVSAFIKVARNPEHILFYLDLNPNRLHSHSVLFIPREHLKRIFLPVSFLRISYNSHSSQVGSTLQL